MREPAGVDVISVGPLFAEVAPGGVQYSVVVVIVADKTGKDFVPSYIMLDLTEDPSMAVVYRTAMIIALDDGKLMSRVGCCTQRWRNHLRAFVSIFFCQTGVA